MDIIVALLFVVLLGLTIAFLVKKSIHLKNEESERTKSVGHPEKFAGHCPAIIGFTFISWLYHWFIYSGADLPAFNYFLPAIPVVWIIVYFIAAKKRDLKTILLTTSISLVTYQILVFAFLDIRKGFAPITIYNAPHILALLVLIYKLNRTKISQCRALFWMIFITPLHFFSISIVSAFTFGIGLMANVAVLILILMSKIKLKNEQ